MKKRNVLGLALLATSVGVEAEELIELPPYEVIGTPANVYRTPGSAYVIDGQLLEDYRLDDLNRLLNRVPGVYFREEDGYGLLANISLRGVDTSRSSKLTLMEDGIPTAPAPYSAPAAYYTPTLGRMSSVEVLKGTSQVRYGPHTTGGVINYISTPLLRQSARSLELAGGSDGEFRSHAWWNESWEGEAGTLMALAEVYHRQNDGFRTILGSGAYPGDGDTGFERTDTMLKLGYLSEDARHSLEFKIGYSDLEANISYLGLNRADFETRPHARYAASRNDTLFSEHTRSYLTYTYKISDEWKLSWKAYYNKFHRNWYKLHDIRDMDTDGNGVPQSLEGEARSGMGLSQAVAGADESLGLEVLKGERAGILRIRNNNRDYYLAGSEAVVSGRHTVGGWDALTTLGIRYHVDRIRRFQWHDLFTQDANASWSAPQTSEHGSDGNRRQHTGALALFAEQTFNNGPWSIRPGIRFESLDMRYTNYTSDAASLVTLDLSDRLNVWAGGVATAYAVDDGNLIFANLYRGYSVPNPGGYLVNHVEEEVSTSAELGYRHRPEGSSLSAEIVAFYTHYEDLIVIDNIGSGNTSGLDPQTESAGSVNSYGLEFLLERDLVSDAAYRIPLTLSASWTVAELDGDSRSTDAESIFSGGRDGSPVPYIPEFKVNLSLGFETERFETGINLSWQDATNSSASGATDARDPLTGEADARYARIDSVTLVDWHLNVRVSAEVTVFASVKNLFDTSYLVSAHPHGPRSGAPRTLLGGVHWRF